MSYIFFALLAAFSYACGTIIGKFTSKHALRNWEQLLVFFYLTYNVFPLIIVPFIALPTWPYQAISPIFFNALFFILGAIFFFKSLLIIDASVAAPLNQIQGAAIGILAYLFLGERFPLISYFWLLLIILGSVAVSIDEKLTLRSFLEPPVMYMILANLLFAISNFFSGIALKTQSSWNIMFWTPVFTTLLTLLFISFKRPNLKVSFFRFSPMFGVGLFQFIGSASILIAFRQNLTISGILGLLSSPIVFLVAILSSKFFPRLLEHHSTKVYAIRAVGLIITLFAAIQIGLKK